MKTKFIFFFNFLCIYLGFLMISSTFLTAQETNIKISLKPSDLFKSKNKIKKFDNIIEYPLIDKGVRDNLWKVSISSISKLADKTTVRLKIRGEYGGEVHFDRANLYTLVDAKTRKEYITNGTFPTKEKPLKVSYNEPSYTTLEFPPLPESVDIVDLIQGSKANGWNFKGIKIGKKFYNETPEINYYTGVMVKEELDQVAKVSVVRTILGGKINYSIKGEWLLSISNPSDLGFKYSMEYSHYEDYGLVQESDRKIFDGFNTSEFLYEKHGTKDDAYDLELELLANNGGVHNIWSKIFLVYDEKKTVFKTIGSDGGPNFCIYKDEGLSKKGIYIDFQTQNTNWDENALKNQVPKIDYIEYPTVTNYKGVMKGLSILMGDDADKKLNSNKICESAKLFGRPYIKIGKFDEKYQFIDGIILSYTDISIKEMFGFRKIIAPIVNGAPYGNGLMQKWDLPDEGAYSYSYIGKINGFNFMNGSVLGFNTDGQKSQECACNNTNLSCRNLIKTSADQRWEEFALALGTTVVGTAVLIKAICANIDCSISFTTNLKQDAKPAETICSKVEKSGVEKINGIKGIPFHNVNCLIKKEKMKIYFWTEENEKSYKKIASPLDMSSSSKNGYYLEEDFDHDRYLGLDLEKAIVKVCGCK